MANPVSERFGAEIKLIGSEPTVRRYWISLAGERLRTVEEKYINAAKTSAHIPGFRKGRTPEGVLLDKVGEWVKERTSRDVLSAVVGDIIQQDELKTVYPPVISKIEYLLSERLSFEAAFEVEPAFEVKGYKGLELERWERPVTDTEVQSELDQLVGQERASYLMPVAEPVNQDRGHWVLLDIEVRDPKADAGTEPVLRWKSELISLSEECIPLGLREAIEGLSAGGSKSWSASLDDDCPVEGWSGGALDCRLSLQEVKIAGEPEFPAALADGFQDKISQLKDKVLQGLTQRRLAASRRHLEEQSTAEILRENPFDAPAAEVELRVAESLERARRLYAMSGRQIDPQHEAELKVKYGVEAANEVRLAYCLRDIARRENISANEIDFQGRLGLAEREEEREEILRQKETVMQDILATKVFDYLIANARIKDQEV